MRTLTFLALLSLLIVGADAGLTGLAAYGVCQTGCNTAWVECVAAAGM